MLTVAAIALLAVLPMGVAIVLLRPQESVEQTAESGRKRLRVIRGGRH